MIGRKVLVLKDSPFSAYIEAGEILTITRVKKNLSKQGHIRVLAGGWHLTIDNIWVVLVHEEPIDPPNIPEVVIAQGVIK